MSAGSGVGWIDGADDLVIAVSAGLLAGEGLGGVFNALLAVIGVSGSGKLHFVWLARLVLTFSLDGYGTAIGCPGFEYCG